MKRCMKCMEIIEDDNNQICPYCGFDNSSIETEAVHLLPGTLLNDRYIIGSVIGYGGFGVTYIGWDGKLEQKVAIKEYMPSDFSTRVPGFSQLTVFDGEKQEQFLAGLNKFVEEARRLAKFQNEPGIVKIFDSFEENGTAYIIMEYLDGETLSDYLKEVGTIQEDIAIDMLMPVMESLKNVHEEGLLHRDIAPDNIFITKTGEIKLIDFGASRYATTTHSRSLTVIVKPGYSPEEQYRSRSDQGTYTDVYSLAATLYKMITGKTPPDAMERRAKYENQNKDILTAPHKINKKISVNREIAILNALNVEIEKRTPDVSAFIQELTSETCPKRVYGRIKKIDLYTWPLWMKISVPVAAALLITFAVLVSLRTWGLDTNTIIIPDGVVVVPDVEKLEKEVATETLEQAGLIVYYGEAIYTEYVEDNLVVSQDPLGGFYMERGGEVIISTAYGNVVAIDENGMATVPYVCNMSLEQANERLKEAGLAQPKIEYVADEYVQEGFVCKQSEDSGMQLDEGTEITLYVSTGPASFQMPDVIGMNYAEAIDLLEGYGLKVSTTKVNDKKIPVGCIATQSIEKDSEVRKGDSVSLGISSTESTIKVPNVVGLAKKEAVKILEDSKFTVSVLENYDMNTPKGNVISQTPEAGTTQENGAKVTIFISKGKMPIQVIFDANGGKAGSSKKTVYYGDAFGELPDATQNGYTFEGWYYSSLGGTKVTSSTIVNSSTDITLYALWSGGQYKLIFDPNGGTLSNTTLELNAGSSYGTLPEPLRKGYEFEGWYTSPSGGTQVSSSTKMEGHDTTIYAHWETKQYVLTYDANGGTVSPTEKLLEMGDEYGTLPTPTRRNYDFEGWYSSDGELVTSSTKMKSADTKITAKWTIKSYILYFDANGGNVSETKRTVQSGTEYGTLPTPTSEKYDFDGWYSDAEKGTQITASTKMGEEDTTIYAHWTTKKYKLTLDAAGGSVSTTEMKLEEGEAFGSLPTPERDNYIFDGWFFSDGTAVSSSATMQAADITITAYWTIKSYKLTFDANGGSVSETSRVVKSGEAYGSLPTPTNNYYHFDGWYTSSSGGDSITDSTKMGTSDVTVYAHWSIIVSTITFDANGGTASESSRDVKYGSTIGSLPSASKDYCKFEGWQTSSGTMLSSSDTMGDSDFTAYAKWSDNPDSDWVSESSVPSGAMIVDTKWTYDETIWIETSSSSESGYTLDDSKTVCQDNSHWSDWIDNGKSAVSSSDTREVETYTVSEYQGSYTTSYYLVSYCYMKSDGKDRHYYASPLSSLSGYSSSYGGNTSIKGCWARDMTVSDLSSWSSVDSGGYGSGLASNAKGTNKSGQTGYYQSGGNAMYFVSSTTTEDIYADVTCYKYRDWISEYSYTYYHYKVESRESSQSVSAGENISNVQKFVKYREK